MAAQPTGMCFGRHVGSDPVGLGDQRRPALVVPVARMGLGSRGRAPTPGGMLGGAADRHVLWARCVGWAQ